MTSFTRALYGDDPIISKILAERDPFIEYATERRKLSSSTQIVAILTIVIVGALLVLGLDQASGIAVAALTCLTAVPAFAFISAASRRGFLATVGWLESSRTPELRHQWHRDAWLVGVRGSDMVKLAYLDLMSWLRPAQLTFPVVVAAGVCVITMDISLTTAGIIEATPSIIAFPMAIVYVATRLVFASRRLPMFSPLVIGYALQWWSVGESRSASIRFRSLVAAPFVLAACGLLFAVGEYAFGIMKPSLIQWKPIIMAWLPWVSLVAGIALVVAAEVLARWMVGQSDVLVRRFDKILATADDAFDAHVQGSIEDDPDWWRSMSVPTLFARRMGLHRWLKMRALACPVASRGEGTAQSPPPSALPLQELSTHRVSPTHLQDADATHLD